MSTPFTELVISAPFLFVKGFLMGFMHGRNENFDYFFHRKAGILRETLSEVVKEFFAIDNHTDLCIPNYVVGEFEKAIQRLNPDMGVTIVEKKEIKDAEFNFSFKIFNPEQAEICKKLFTSLPSGVELLNFAPKELIEKEKISVQEYAPIHPYVYQGEGIAKGDFGGVMHLFLAIKRSEISDSILCSEIRLNFKSEK